MIPSDHVVITTHYSFDWIAGCKHKISLNRVEDSEELFLLQLPQFFVFGREAALVSGIKGVLEDTAYNSTHGLTAAFGGCGDG